MSHFKELEKVVKYTPSSVFLSFICKRDQLMTRNYDNWVRLVAAVIKRQQFWELCHQHSRTPSICSEASSSDFSSSFRSSDVDYKSETKDESHLKLVFLRGSTVIPLKGAFKSPHDLGKGRVWNLMLVQLKHDVNISETDFLASGTELVIKFLNEVKVEESEFKQKMMVFGNCRHENVSAPRAFCFSDKANGKLAVYDYHSQGSVYDMLHGNKSTNPNWETRLKIAIGAARGIAHMHAQYGGKMAHGYIKSSNIFLNSKQYGCVSDFSLVGIMSAPPRPKGLGYGAAAYEYFKSVSQEMDVHNFGNFLLELLTGKSPLEAQGFDKDLHLATWVRSVKPEEWASKLLDQSFTIQFTNDSVKDSEATKVNVVSRFQSNARVSLGYFRSRELKEMLQVAMRCLAVFPYDRPKMFEIVLMLENIGRYLLI